LKVSESDGLDGSHAAKAEPTDGRNGHSTAHTDKNKFFQQQTNSTAEHDHIGDVMTAQQNRKKRGYDLCHSHTHAPPHDDITTNTALKTKKRGYTTTTEPTAADGRKGRGR